MKNSLTFIKIHPFCFGGVDLTTKDTSLPVIKVCSLFKIIVKRKKVTFIGNFCIQMYSIIDDGTSFPGLIEIILKTDTAEMGTINLENNKSVGDIF